MNKQKAKWKPIQISIGPINIYIVVDRLKLIENCIRFYAEIMELFFKIHIHNTCYLENIMFNVLSHNHDM